MLRLQLGDSLRLQLSFNVAYTKVVALNAQWPSPSSGTDSDSDSDYEYDSDGPARVRRR